MRVEIDTHTHTLASGHAYTFYSVCVEYLKNETC